MQNIVIVIGNLGAGKSALAGCFAQQNYDVVVIDDFRKLANGELHAREQMLITLTGLDNDFVFETTCSNISHNKCMRAIQQKHAAITRVKLLVSEETSRKRCENRQQKNPFGFEHGKSFAYMQERIRKEWSDLLFDTETMTTKEIYEEIKKANQK
jgi:chloramphenicol 3-O-phosphotransferase